ncbi:MAG: PorT family protein [Prevotella sp.]|nr:PorT family protein [Prevotella sp.]
MKRVSILLYLFVAVVACNAQQPSGKFTVVPKVGVNISNLNSFKWTGSETLKPASSKMKAGMTIGAEVEYQATENVSVSGGLLYSMQGVGYDDFVIQLGKKEFEGVRNFRLNLQYVNMPLLVRRYLFKGFAVAAGVQPGILIDARAKSDVTEWSLDDDGKTIYGRQYDVDSKWDSTLRRFDLSIPVGLSYEWEKVVIEARYNIGVIHVFRNDGFPSRNGVMSFTVGYRI